MGKAENELLQRYFDDELPADERARVEAGLTEDDRLRLQALAEIRGLVGQALDAEAAEVDLWPGIAGRLGDPPPRPRRWRGRTAGMSAGLAAMAVAALLVLFKPWQGRPNNNCDIEQLETDGAVATVLQMADMPHGPTTVIWTEED